MSLQEAQNFFQNLSAVSTKKSEIKIFEKFIHILTELKNRTFTKEETQFIEAELESLDLNSNRENNIKFFKKALSKFESFLKNTFSLTSKDYFTRLGAGLGSSFGLLFGIVFLSGFERSLGIALGLSIGMLVGLTTGRYLDAKAKREGRVL